MDIEEYVNKRKIHMISDARFLEQKENNLVLELQAVRNQRLRLEVELDVLNKLLMEVNEDAGSGNGDTTNTLDD